MRSRLLGADAKSTEKFARVRCAVSCDAMLIHEPGVLADIAKETALFCAEGTAAENCIAEPKRGVRRRTAIEREGLLQ